MNILQKKANYGRNRHGVVKIIMRFDKGTINTHILLKNNH